MSPLRSLGMYVCVCVCVFECHLLMVPWVGLWSLSVIIPAHTHSFS